MKDNAKKLPFSTKLGYGAAELSSSLTWTMVAVVFLFFLTDVVGMEPALAGFVLMLGTLWDAFTDPAMGILSDRIRTRWGRRRPFLLAVAVPYGLITWLLFTDFGLSETGTMIYFILAIVLYYTAGTVLEVPYTSLAAEMTQDYDERASLIGFRAAFSQLASIIGAALPWVMVAHFAGILGGKKAGWSLTSAIFGLLSIFPILWTWRVTRGRELYPEETRVRFRDILHGPLKNRTFRYTIALIAAGNVGLSLAGAVMVYFMKYYMNFTETQESMAFLFLFACTILWIPVINKVTYRYGKKESFILFIGIWALIQGVGALLLQPSMVLIFYIMMILASSGVVSISLTGLSMIPDAIEVDEFKTGQRREGIYVGVNWFTRKFSVALMLWIVGIILSWIGYVPDTVQTENAICGIRLLYAEGTALFLLISIVLAYLMPMTRKGHEALKEAIRLKKAGEKWDDSSIQDLL